MFKNILKLIKIINFQRQSYRKSVAERKSTTTTTIALTMSKVTVTKTGNPSNLAST